MINVRCLFCLGGHLIKGSEAPGKIEVPQVDRQILLGVSLVEDEMQKERFQELGESPRVDLI